MGELLLFLTLAISPPPDRLGDFLLPMPPPRAAMPAGTTIGVYCPDPATVAWVSWQGTDGRVELRQPGGGYRWFHIDRAAGLFGRSGPISHGCRP